MKLRKIALPFVLAALAIAGCSAPTTQRTDASLGPRKPDLTLQIGSLNLSGHTKRFEKKELEKLSRILKKEQIDVLSVQGIVRYPGLQNRVDFVDELAAKSEMQIAFGEMVNSSGRQTGNGIFSAYPLRNKHNDPFDGIKSAQFEAAMQSSVDGGVKDIVVVSTLLPAKAPEADQIACVKMIAGNNATGMHEPVIMTGNLPSSDNIRASGGYEDVYETFGTLKPKQPATRIWFTNNGSLKLLNARTVDTDFGPLLVAQFGLFR